MLEFGEKLTVMPSAMEERDLEALRRAGFTDREIVGLAAAAAYRNFITRIADGLGVELGVHGDGYYDSAVLHAFGVSERAIGGTLYADRERAGIESAASPARPRPQRAGADDSRVAWIDTGSEPPVAASASFGNLARALGLKPETREATLGFARLVDGGRSGLDTRSEAIVGLVVAATLGLAYLGAHHAQRLLDSGMTADGVRALVDEPAGGGLDGPERAIAAFCAKLTREPGAMARADLEALRAAGLNDGAIVATVAVASF